MILKVRDEGIKGHLLQVGVSLVSSAYQLSGPDLHHSVHARRHATCTCTYHPSLKDPNCKIIAHLKCLFLYIFLFLVCEDWRV